VRGGPREGPAAEHGAKQRCDLTGGRDDPAAGPVERQVELRDVHGLRPLSRHERVVGREIAARTIALERLFDEIGSRQAQRREDTLLQGIPQRYACRLLDDQRQDDVVAAAIRPPLAGLEQAGLPEHEPQLVEAPELPAVRGVTPVRLEERNRIADEVLQPARVVQQPAHGDALGEGSRVGVELEQPLCDQPQNERGHEDLRHAPDAEAVTGRERLAGANVRQPRRGLDPLVGPGRDHGHAGNAGRDDPVELILERAQTPAAVTTKSVAKPRRIPASRSQVTSTGWPYLRFTANSSRTT